MHHLKTCTCDTCDILRFELLKRRMVRNVQQDMATASATKARHNNTK